MNISFTPLEIILLVFVLLATGALIGHHFASFSFGNALTNFANRMRSDLADAERAIKGHLNAGLDDVKSDVAEVKTDLSAVAGTVEQTAAHAAVAAEKATQAAAAKL